MIDFFFDVDGVILDFEQSIIDMVRETHLPDLPLDYEVKSWDLKDDFTSLDMDAIWEEYMRGSWFERLKLLIDKDSFNKLSEENNVFFVTNIPVDQSKKREKNFSSHGLKYNGLFLAGHYNFGDPDYPSKSSIISQKRSEGNRLVFIDDHPKNCTDVLESIPDAEVYMMTRPHNISKQDVGTRVDNWSEFLTSVYNK